MKYLQIIILFAGAGAMAFDGTCGGGVAMAMAMANGVLETDLWQC